MKKVIYSVLCLTVIILFACNSNKKAENLQELTKKYDGKNFNNCNSYFSASEEILDVYFATIDKAYEGDEKAWRDIEEFDEFLYNFQMNADIDKIMEECPERYETFNATVERRNEEYTPKLLQLILDRYDFDFDEYDDDMIDIFEREEMLELEPIIEK